MSMMTVATQGTLAWTPSLCGKEKNMGCGDVAAAVVNMTWVKSLKMWTRGPSTLGVTFP